MHTKKLPRLFLASALVAVSLFVWSPRAAFAFHWLTEDVPEDTEISDEIRDATVNLYCRLKAGRKTYATTGSGVFIDDGGVILTNAHVAQYFLLDGAQGKVSGRCSIRTGSPAKERYTASVLYFPSIWVEQNKEEIKKGGVRGTGVNDFALLYVTGVKKGAMPLAFPTLPIDVTGTIAEGDTVAVAGYPSGNLDFEGIRKELMLIAASPKITDTNALTRTLHLDLLTLESSAVGSPGISGGPVVDGDSEVVGIAALKNAAKKSHVLRAITVSYIDRMLTILTGQSLETTLAGDLAKQAEDNKEAMPADTLKIITSGLLGTSKK